MLINNRFIQPQMTYVGKGKILELPTLITDIGKGLVVHGKSLTSKESFTKLKKQLSDCHFYTHKGNEPILQDIRDVLQFCKGKDIKWIAGIGGGSVLDLAKAAAGLFNAELDPQEYQKGAKLNNKGIPFIAAPTTAGSGAEATINAVIIDESTNTKLSIRDDSFMADIIIIDPELMIGCPANIIAHSGMDAITQAIESYFSRNACWMSENLANKAFELLINSIEKTYQSALHGKIDIEAAENMLTGSYLAGIAFTNSRLGVVHGLAHPLGSLYHEPHGLICAICLAPSIEINKDYAPEKYKELSDSISCDLLKRINDLNEKLNINNVLKGKEIIHKQSIIDYTLSSGSTKASPKDIDEKDVRWLLEQVF